MTMRPITAAITAANAAANTAATTLTLFCQVVDNFGDIGICWRLARQLTQEHGLAVTLWVDDLASFQRICPTLQCQLSQQQVEGVAVRYWDRDPAAGLFFTPAEVGDIVVEFFGCALPPGFLEAMAARAQPPVWLNLEGLSAEDWVESCHGLASPARLGLSRYFYFPGFTQQTGGLLRESALLAQRDQFQADRVAQTAFLAELGLSADEIAATKISLFCYPSAPVSALFDIWQASTVPLTCLVPEGVASAAVSAFFGPAVLTPFVAQPVPAGAVCSRGGLTVRVLPFVAQPAYDQLLWACDLNFVRGEDSFVRAQWAGRPFVWQLYEQDENLHHVKLQAFLARYAQNLTGLAEFSQAWNGMSPTAQQAGAGWQAQWQARWQALWQALRADFPKIHSQTPAWTQKMEENGDFAGNLLSFARALQATPPELKV